MEANLCVRCDENEVEFSPYCKECWDYHISQDSWWDALREASPYTAAIVAARDSVEDFDTLETGWGL